MFYEILVGSIKNLGLLLYEKTCERIDADRFGVCLKWNQKKELLLFFLPYSLHAIYQHIIFGK